jgi:hypothetical protein
VWLTEDDEHPYYKYDGVVYKNDIYRVGGKPALFTGEPYFNPDTQTMTNTRLQPATEEELETGIIMGSDEHMTKPIDRDKFEWLTNAEEEINGEAAT